MKQRPAGIVFALAVGLIVATLSYRWVVDPTSRDQRDQELRAAAQARVSLLQFIGSQRLEIVDPLEPDRKVGKVYIYPAGDGWEVSGFYRRDETDLWHPWLMRLDADLETIHLRVSDQDARLVEQARQDPAIEVLP
jgi:hypothetical protein